MHPRLLTANSSPGIVLQPDEIHLWLARYDQIEDEQLHAQYRSLLSAEERMQEGRYYFARDRRRYLVTRALVRSVLSRYAEVAAAEWKFVNNEYGRPRIANPIADTALSFNISHTHSLIVLGIATGRAIGVDVENFRTRDAPLKIADRFFAPEEVSELAAVPPQHKQYRFFEYWTFKEAYIKARGMGLSLPLDKFHFSFPHDRGVAIATYEELADDPSRWQFWQLRASADYLIAVCAERVEPRPTLIVRQTAPLAWEEIVAPHLLRTSE